MPEPSLFTRIINGEIPAHRVYEDDRVIAFLTIQPFSDGHTLVVPKKQVDQVWDLEDDDYEYLWQTTKKIALHMRQVLKVDRVSAVIKGFEVPHAHIHLIPINLNDGVSIDPESPPPQADDNKLAEIAARIRF